MIKEVKVYLIFYVLGYVLYFKAMEISEAKSMSFSDCPGEEMDMLLYYIVKY